VRKTGIRSRGLRSREIPEGVRFAAAALAFSHASARGMVQSVIFRFFTLAFLLYRMYRRLPRSQQRQLREALQRHGPRIASTAAKRARRR
jgi:hypothetical protein